MPVSSGPGPSNSSLWRSDVPPQRACTEYLQLQSFAARLHCVFPGAILLTITSQEKLSGQMPCRPHQSLLQNLRKI